MGVASGAKAPPPSKWLKNCENDDRKSEIFSPMLIHVSDMSKLFFVR